MSSTRLYLFKINFETVLKSAIASYGGILAVFPTLRKFSVVFFFREVQEKSSRTSKIRDDYICRKAGAIYEYCWSIW